MGIMTTLSDLDKINKTGNARINVALTLWRLTTSIWVVPHR